MADENISLLEKGNAIGYGLGGTCVIKAEYFPSVDVFSNDTVDTI
jgi:hypothetical protein